MARYFDTCNFVFLEHGVEWITINAPGMFWLSVSQLKKDLSHLLPAIFLIQHLTGRAKL